MHLKLNIYFLLFITITDSLSSDWEKFKSDYNKQYESPAEEAQRQQIFLENVNRIKEYQTTHPDATFTMGINHLTDQRIEELVFGSKSFINLHSETNEEPIEVKAIIPTRLDWRYENVTTSVYNQSAKISAPAIAAVEVIESYQAIQTKNLVRGSVNQVSVCCGNTIDVFDCILSKLGGGICSEVAYNLSTTTCNRNACEPFVVFSSIKKLELAKETTMLEWIQDSPLYIGIDASQITFQTYESGIYLDMNCSKTDVNHVLQLVGYGFQSGIPYWLCKNSWGEGWGEQGYIRIERGRNVCGIATYVVQIENKNIINNAVRLLTFNGVYLALFSLFVYIFVILK